MNNLSPPLETPLRAYKETPLRALDVPKKIPLPTNLQLAWFRSGSFQAVLGPLNAGGTTACFMPFYYGSWPNPLEGEATFGFQQLVEINTPYSLQSTIRNDLDVQTIIPNSAIFISSIRTEYGTNFEGGGATYGGFAYGVTGDKDIAGGPPDPALINPVFQVLYNSGIPPGERLITLSMDTAADHSRANGQIYFVPVFGERVLITNFDWVEGFSALTGDRAGSITFNSPPYGGRVLVVIQDLTFLGPGPIPVPPGDAFIDGNANTLTIGIE